MKTDYTPPTAAEFRALRGTLTQKRLADRLSISKSAVEKYEDGRMTVPLHTWEFAKALFGHPDAMMTLKNQAG